MIRPSKSNWSSALHMVLKKNNDWRPCGDFRRLNSASQPDKYMVPHLQDFSANLHGCTVFSKIDLVKAFHQIPVEPRDIHKTATVTPFGTYEWLVMPFGLRNASQTFQRFMDEVMRGVPNIFVYIDDILIASANQEEHEKHLRTVFQRLDNFGIKIHPDKCVIAVPELEFLGHHISSKGIAPTAEKTSAINNFARPATQQKLREFLGMINFYRRFLKQGTDSLKPLSSLITSPKKGKSTEVIWTEEAENAFKKATKLLSKATYLNYPCPGAPISIAVDASEISVGAVLQQHFNNHWQPGIPARVSPARIGH